MFRDFGCALGRTGEIAVRMCCICGPRNIEIPKQRTMPALPRVPAATKIGMNEDGEI
jgi:hypothetical protein